MERFGVYSIIDAHCHLGNILFRGGGSLIPLKGVRKRPVFDPLAISEIFSYRWSFPDRLFARLFPRITITAQCARNALGTHENLRRSMGDEGISLSVCMPVPPHVTGEDILNVHERDPSVIPFTGVDFTKRYDMAAWFARDVGRGARGLKLHPILQGVSLDSVRTFEAVDAFASHGLPVLFHCGVCSYYHRAERGREVPRYGKACHAARLVREFPNVKFIVGHAGLDDVHDVVDQLAMFPNVWVDTSFQGPRVIRGLAGVFGPDKVLFASDWPWGSRSAAIRAVKLACRGDRGLEQRIFCINAASLMNIPLLGDGSKTAAAAMEGNPDPSSRRAV
ncbi:MAG TPA: amidohydrolase family protein [Deltaproteobacteria bacterium]|nr:amidohydrolase family protein [Deltaproteobacteria bacterium]HQQ15995.1 amidohydrolase family protein [Deltaproteobacteria bacterium]